MAKSWNLSKIGMHIPPEETSKKYKQTWVLTATVVELEWKNGFCRSYKPLFIGNENFQFLGAIFDATTHCCIILNGTLECHCQGCFHTTSNTVTLHCPWKICSHENGQNQLSWFIFTESLPL
jgi:hypothetical protein